MDRVERINELIHVELAKLINKEVFINGAMITVCHVDTSPDLLHAKVFISVLPEKFYGSALTVLKKNSPRLVKSLEKKLKLRNVPKFHWVLDTTERDAARLEEVFKKIA